MLGQAVASLRLEPDTVVSCLSSLLKLLSNQALLSSLNLTNSDILTIYDGDELTARILGQYVGSSGPQKLYSSSPDLTIQFHSDPAGLIFGKGQGFIMNYIGRESRLLGACPALPCQHSADGDRDMQLDQVVQVLSLEAGRIAVTPALLSTSHRAPAETPSPTAGCWVRQFWGVPVFLPSSRLVLQERSGIFGLC